MRRNRSVDTLLRKNLSGLRLRSRSGCCKSALPCQYGVALHIAIHTKLDAAMTYLRCTMRPAGATLRAGTAARCRPSWKMRCEAIALYQRANGEVEDWSSGWRVVMSMFNPPGQDVACARLPRSAVSQSADRRWKAGGRIIAQTLGPFLSDPEQFSRARRKFLFLHEPRYRRQRALALTCRSDGLFVCWRYASGLGA